MPETLRTYLFSASVLRYRVSISHILWSFGLHLRECIKTFPDWVITRSNTRGYGGKTH